MRVHLVGFTGAARSGKDTLARAVHHEVHRWGETWDAQCLAFADPLKEACAAFLGMPLEAMSKGNREQLIEGFNFSVRHMLQHIGTEGFRQLDPDVFVKLARRSVEKDVDFMTGSSVTDYVTLITDVRFPNEAEFIRGSGGLLVHVRKMRVEGDDEPVGLAGHRSEAGIPMAPGDYDVAAPAGRPDTLMNIGVPLIRDWLRHRCEGASL